MATASMPISTNWMTVRMNVSEALLDPAVRSMTLAVDSTVIVMMRPSTMAAETKQYRP